MINLSRSFTQPLFLVGLLLVLTWSCEKEDPPKLSTAEVTEITINSATSGGNITDDGGAEITARGVVWSTAENPTVDNNVGKTTDDQGSGQFTSNLTDLSPGTTYFVRAYAVNSAGTSYGNQKQFTTIVELASVTTAKVADIRSTSARSGGKVTDDGGAEVTARGVVWGETENPVIDNNDGITNDGEGADEFISELLGLSPITKYYVRAYATNSIGTAYGEQEYFETPGLTGQPCPGMPTFTDPRDGTVYNTVQIGNQCWLKENLKYLPEVYPTSSNSSSEARYYVSDYRGDDVSEALATDNYKNYGVLYNWPAAMNGEKSSSANPSGVQGACPAGWHLPSDGEWTELLDYLMDEYDLTNNSDDVNGVGNKLKSCSQVDSPLGGACDTYEHPRWDSHEIHYGTDDFGFSALPGGWITESGSGVAYNFGYSSNFWSSTENSRDIRFAFTRSLYLSYGYLMHYGASNKMRGLAMRCVRDID